MYSPAMLHKYYLNTVTGTVSKHKASPVMLHKYYLNTVTRTASNHTDKVMSCYTNITLSQSHVLSVNTQL
jgi:hypothetical protein